MTTLFRWEDIQKARAQSNKMIAMLNDERKIPNEVIAAFANYAATPIAWSERNKHIADLKIA